MRGFSRLFLQGNTNESELTETGRAQAVLAREALQHVEFVRCVVDQTYVDQTYAQQQQQQQHGARSPGRLRHEACYKRKHRSSSSIGSCDCPATDSSCKMQLQQRALSGLPSVFVSALASNLTAILLCSALLPACAAAASQAPTRVLARPQRSCGR